MKHLKERGQKYYFDSFISFTILWGDSSSGSTQRCLYQISTALNLLNGKFMFERFNIVIIELFKFQNMCIYMHHNSHFISISFELFDLKNIYYQSCFKNYDK
jgi:hypothetical protein